MEEEGRIQEDTGRGGEEGRSRMGMMGGVGMIGTTGEGGGRSRKEGEEEQVMGGMEGQVRQAGRNAFASCKGFVTARRRTQNVRIITRICVLRIGTMESKGVGILGCANSYTRIIVTV